LSRGLYGAITVVGLAAFLYPLWLPADAAPTEAHANSAPFVAAALVALLVLALGVEVHLHRMRAATIAVLGVLAATTGLLRLLDLPGGGSGMFFLLILAGAAFGPRFGLLLGLSSMMLGAVVTGGLGPWLPFQMLGAGWMGALAGWVGHLTVRASPRTEVAVLALLGWILGFAYGALLNLWSWPFTVGLGDLGWEPGLTLRDTLVHYYRYYLTTSLAWDAAGALANALLILLVGAALLATLRRFADRLEPVVLLGPGPPSHLGAEPHAGDPLDRVLVDVVGYPPQPKLTPRGGGSRSKSGADPQP